MAFKYTLRPLIVGVSMLTLLYSSTIGAKDVDHATWNKWIKIAGIDDQISSLMVTYRSLSEGEKQAAIKTTIQDIKDAKQALIFNEGDKELQKQLAKEQVILSILTYRVPEQVFGDDKPTSGPASTNNWNDLLKQAKWETRPEFIKTMTHEFQNKPAYIRHTLSKNIQEHLQKTSAMMDTEKNKKKRDVLRKNIARDKIKLFILSNQSPKI